jgi:hypothetical protein
MEQVCQKKVILAYFLCIKVTPNFEGNDLDQVETHDVGWLYFQYAFK